jgi:hypothetical protein
MALARSEQDALTTLLSFDDCVSSRDDDVPSPRVPAAATGGGSSKLRPWAARAGDSSATAKIRASNLTQVMVALARTACGEVMSCGCVFLQCECSATMRVMRSNAKHSNAVRAGEQTA